MCIRDSINTAEEESLHVGTKVADKMAHEAHEAAEKADNLKNKMCIRDRFSTVRRERFNSSEISVTDLSSKRFKIGRASCRERV